MGKTIDKTRSILLIVLVMVLSSLPSQGQQIRYWSEGPLSWKDFSVGQTHDTIPYLSVSWARHDAVVKSGKTVFKYNEIRTHAYPGNSWVTESMMTDSELALLQDFFNQAEWLGRAMRDTLIHGKVSWKKLSRQYSDKLRVAQESIRKGATTVPPPGEDLFSIIDISYTTSKIGVGGSIMLGCSIPYGDMADIYAIAPMAMASLGANLGRFHLYGRMALSRGEYEGKSLTSYGWNFGPEFDFLKRNNVSLAVFGGIGTKTVPFKPDPSKGIYLMEGLSMDYLLRNEVLFTSEKAMYRRWLRVSLFADQLYNSSRGIYIPTLNLSLGLSIIRNGLKINN